MEISSNILLGCLGKWGLKQWVSASAKVILCCKPGITLFTVCLTLSLRENTVTSAQWWEICRMLMFCYRILILGGVSLELSVTFFIFFFLFCHLVSTQWDRQLTLIPKLHQFTHTWWRTFFSSVFSSFFFWKSQKTDHNLTRANMVLLLEVLQQYTADIVLFASPSSAPHLDPPPQRLGTGKYAIEGRWGRKGLIYIFLPALLSS